MKIEKGCKFPDIVFNTVKEQGLHLNPTGTRKSLLWMLRYTGCTICQYDLYELAQARQQFDEKNVDIYAVVQSDTAHTAAYLESSGNPLTLISDPEMKLYAELEVKPAGSLQEMLGEDPAVPDARVAKAESLGFTHGDSEGEELQLPAAFLIDENGIVLYAHYAKHITDMPSPEDVLAML